MIIIDNTDEELITAVRQYAEDNQISFYKINNFLGPEQWALILQSVEAFDNLWKSSFKSLFEEGTVVIDSTHMEDTAHKIIKYLRQNPEVKERAKKLLKKRKLKIQGSAKFVTAIEQELRKDNHEDINS